MFQAGEQLWIPAPVDVHVHLREPGGEQSETIASGTLAAEDGGYQLVCDMPNNPNGNETVSAHRVLQKKRIAENDSFTDIGFFSGVDFDNPDMGEISAIAPLTIGPKYYMGFTTGNATERTLDDVRDYTDAYITETQSQGRWQPISLHAHGEVGYETARYIAMQGNPVRWCHVSSAEEVKYAEQLQKDFPGLFWAEVTPHHLTMTDRDADLKYGWNGGRMQPPLAEGPDADALLYAYNKGTLAILATDHAPHPAAKKLAAELENPTGVNEPDETTCFGVSGIEFVLPVMFSLVARNMITTDRLIDSLHTQPLNMLGMPRRHPARSAQTQIEVGPYVIGEDDLRGKSRNTPYINWTAWARVLAMKKHGQMYQVGPARKSDRPNQKAYLYNAQSR